MGAKNEGENAGLFLVLLVRWEFGDSRIYPDGYAGSRRDLLLVTRPESLGGNEYYIMNMLKETKRYAFDERDPLGEIRFCPF